MESLSRQHTTVARMHASIRDLPLKRTALGLLLRVSSEAVPRTAVLQWCLP